HRLATLRGASERYLERTQHRNGQSCHGWDGEQLVPIITIPGRCLAYSSHPPDKLRTGFYKESSVTASKVRADYEQLTQIAQAFGQQAETAQKVLSAMQSNMNTLQAGD